MKRTHNQLTNIILEQDQHLKNLEQIIIRDFYPELGELKKQTDEQLPKINLNNYLVNFRSDENENFSKIVHDDQKEWKEKHWWIEHSRKNQEEKQKMLMCSENKNNYSNMLEGNRNNLLRINAAEQQNNFFFNATKELFDKQLQKYNKQKKIFYENTRLEQSIKPLEYAIEKRDSDYVLDTKLLSTPLLQGIQDQELKKKEKYVLENQQFKKPLTKKKLDISVGGYKIINIPSPSPNAMQSPLMTYGQIESTPERLRQYKVPQTPQRDLILDKLNQNIVNKKKQQKTKKQSTVLKILESCTPNTIKNYLKRKDSSINRKMSSNIRRKDIQQSSQHNTVMEGLLKL